MSRSRRNRSRYSSSSDDLTPGSNEASSNEASSDDSFIVYGDESSHDRDHTIDDSPADHDHSHEHADYDASSGSDVWSNDDNIRGYISSSSSSAEEPPTKKRRTASGYRPVRADSRAAVHTIDLTVGLTATRAATRADSRNAGNSVTLDVQWYADNAHVIITLSRGKTSFAVEEYYGNNNPRDFHDFRAAFVNATYDLICKTSSDDPAAGKILKDLAGNEHNFKLEMTAIVGGKGGRRNFEQGGNVKL